MSTAPASKPVVPRYVTYFEWFRSLFTDAELDKAEDPPDHAQVPADERLAAAAAHPRFEAALADAVSAGSTAGRLDALRRAADAYAGLLLDGCALEWAEPPRESVRRRAADALRQLADLTWDVDADSALGFLERAIVVDQYNEELHHHVMRRQASLGRLDAVRRTYQHLQRSLADIAAEPDHTTRDLLQKLVTGSQNVH